MLKKRFLTIFLIFSSITLIISGCGSNSDTSSKTIRFGNIYNEDTTYGKAINKMADDIEEMSDGTLEVEIFHEGSLGGEDEEIQALHDGSLEMMETGTAGIGTYVPETSVFELWYNLEGLDTLKGSFEDLQDDLDERYQEDGFKLLGAYYDGPRNIISTKKVEDFDDLKGLKFRVPDSTLYVKMAEALNTNASTMPLGDVYTSLQSGTIDAMEGTPDSILNEKFYEPSEYLIQDEHVFQPLSIIYNLDAWEDLSEEEQDIIEEAVQKSSEYHLSITEEANDEALDELEEEGIELIDVTDKDKWKESVDKANQEYAEEQGKLGEKILDSMQNQNNN